MAFYLKAPWNDEELAKLVTSNFYTKFRRKQKIEDLLHALGEPGKAQLKALKQEISISKELEANTKKTIKKSHK